MTPSTHLLQDILREPVEMSRTLDYLVSAGRDPLHHAAAVLRSARHVFLTGIGASWNAAAGAGSMFHRAGSPVYMQEAGELIHVTAIPRGSVLIAISRTGRSIEIVKLLAKAEASGAIVIGITNSPDSPLARQSAISISVPIRLDHAISINTYSTLLIAANALAAASTTGFEAIVSSFSRTIRQAGERLELWRSQLEESTWLTDGVPYCFLARAGSLASSQEAQLLWEEAVKMPASSMSTSAFRHGPQEIVKDGLRFCIWIDQSQMRDEDLAVARDLRKLGASVMLVGENLPGDAADILCQLPVSPAQWQCAIDVLPIQLAAERMSRMVGVDCDSFRVCSFVVEDEHGLLRKKDEVSQNAD